MSSYAKFENANNSIETVVEIVKADVEDEIDCHQNKQENERKRMRNGFLNPLAESASSTDIQSDIREQRIQSHPSKVNDQLEFDHIEVSLVEDVGASKPDEVLTNATDFLVEHNDNYLLSWGEAAQRISDNEDDHFLLQPPAPSAPGCNLENVRFRLRRVIESIHFRILTLLLILLDVIVVVVDLSSSSPSADGGHRISALEIVDLVITLYFVAEIALRIVALTHPVFFSTWYNVVDFAVVLSTLIVVCVALSPDNDWAQKLHVFTVLRFVRVVRLVRLCTVKNQIEVAARQLVSQNKRRYQHDGFDLDLTYVTARVIATSFPSSGLWAWYRNPIEKVASFLDAKHRDKYRIYNLCSEHSYDIKYFHERVERIFIDDHNVPSLQDMLRFVQSVKDWLNSDPDRVIVVHCKGGKGRTGTMICIWLVEAGVFTTANQSLEYFGQRRTDTSVGKKFQGVETPSQSRYVGYYEIMKKRLGGNLPPPCALIIKRIEIRGMKFVGKGDGSDFWFNVSRGREGRVFSAHIGYGRNCHVKYSADTDILTIDVINCPSLEGDIRVLFQTSSNLVPKNYEKCPFYFWFNTSFVKETDDKERILCLSREELDNPHKSKTWHCFRENFQVKLWLEAKSVIGHEQGSSIPEANHDKNSI